jgi:hypothetical protein
MGVRPAAIICDPPYSLEKYRSDFIESMALAMRVPSARDLVMMPYQREIDDVLSGAGRLARARRLLAKGGKRRMKRARRLHRLVYGPHYSEARIQLARSFAIVEQAMRRFTRALTFSSSSMDRFRHELEAIRIRGPFEWKKPRRVWIDPVEIDDAR